MTEELLTLGNTAKLYCLNLISRFRQVRGGPLTLLDLGCGEGANFRRLLADYSDIHYIGVEPDEKACAKARENLLGLNATIRCETAYDVQLEPVDVVVSFSVLEHVYQRLRYIESAKRHLRPDGLFLINYDSGHFEVPGGKVWQRGSDRWNTLLGPVFARFGFEGSYQAPVREAEFRTMASKADLAIVDEKVFNTDLKRAFALVPVEARAEFMTVWHEFELRLNRLGISYRDEMAGVFRTRNFGLVHAGLPRDLGWLFG